MIVGCSWRLLLHGDGNLSSMYGWGERRLWMVGQCFFFFVSNALGNRRVVCVHVCLEGLNVFG